MASGHQLGRWLRAWNLRAGRAIPRGQSSRTWRGVGEGLVAAVTPPLPPIPPQLEPDGLLVWVLAGALGLSLVCSLVSVPLQCFQLNKVYGFCLLLFYVSFLVVALLTEFGVIHLKSV